MNITITSRHGLVPKGTFCPCCGNEGREVRYRVLHDAGESFIYRCQACRLMYLHPLLLAERDDRQMESVNDAELFNSPVLQRLHKLLIVDREIKTVRRLLGRRNFSLLDVGCGTGWITALWRDQGADVTGLEPSQNRRRIACDQRGLRVLDCFVEDLGQEETFDVVTIRHVVEHLQNPRAILDQIRARLRADGLLIVVVPNIDCLGRFLFDTRWSWILPWHCLFFNPHSLKTLVEQSGFRVEKIYQTPSPLWYPESLARVISEKGELTQRLYAKLNIFSLLPFAPLVAAGYVTGFSDNITLIARVKTNESAPS